MPKLRCTMPECKAETGFWPVKEWQSAFGGGHDIVVGIECADCNAEWDMMGNVVYAYGGTPL